MDGTKFDPFLIIRDCLRIKKKSIWDMTWSLKEEELLDKIEERHIKRLKRRYLRQMKRIYIDNYNRSKPRNVENISALPLKE